MRGSPCVDMLFILYQGIYPPYPSSRCNQGMSAIQECIAFINSVMAS
jgi:hypothetical protein